MLVERTVPAGYHHNASRRKRRLRIREEVRPRGFQPRSLDSFKQLATSEKKSLTPSFQDRLMASETARDKRRRQQYMQQVLIDSLKTCSRWNPEAPEWHPDALAGVLDSPEAKKRKRRDWKPWKDVERLQACQSQWIGFKAACCSTSQAVPIGCNHRLCFLCNAHRAEHYRERIRKMLPEMGNAQLLTLTVPNVKALTKRTYDTLRMRLKAFLKENRAFLKGGVYSIETTYNRSERTWHPHIHVLVDIADDRRHLPWKEFRERKLRLEYEWLRQTWNRSADRWSAKDYQRWRDAVELDGSSVPRRVVDIRPVKDAQKAAFEVLKYISKPAAFVDRPQAVQEFLRAVRGVRVIQTFGCWYGFKIEATTPEETLQCDCGGNHFERIGVFGHWFVKLTPQGKWEMRLERLSSERQHRCRGITHGGKHHGNG